MSGDTSAGRGQATPRGTAVLAAADSLHGRLQRGLGDGARAASDHADAAELVLDCLCHDPRWDPQCETRATYYADLVRRLRIPLDAVRKLLFSDDDVSSADSSGPEDFWRTQGALEVLGELSRWGDPEARSLLREYAVAGASWESALNELAEDADTAALGDGMAEAVLDQLDGPALHFAVDVDGGPWRAWADRPRVADALRHRENRPGASRGEITRASRDDLLRLVRGRRVERLAAVGELGRRQDLVLLELAEEELADAALHPAGDWRPMLYPGVFGTAARLAADVVLPRARRWAQLYPGDLAVVSLLCRHGSAEDAAVVLPAYEKVLADSEWGLGCEIPEALARWGLRDAVPLLLGTWHESAYAYARRGLLPAIASLDSELGVTLAEDAIADCEEDVRLTAAGIVGNRRG